MAKRRILPLKDLSADMQRFFDTLTSSSDLAVILVTASYIDASLASMLRRFFLDGSVVSKLLDIRGPLGTIASRSDLAYVLGLIDKPLYQALHKVIEIRNEFAHHHLEHSFEAPEIRKLCEELVYLQALYPREKHPWQVNELLKTSRNTFTLHAVLISQQLVLRGTNVKRVPAA